MQGGAHTRTNTHAHTFTHRPACALPPSLAERGLKMGPKAGEESG